jgi:adenosylhomocysteine nucleosidase
MIERNRQPPIAVLVALEEELRAVSRRLSAPSLEERLRGHTDSDIVLAKSGMGAARARDCAQTLIARCRPRLILIAGFCAGLTQEAAPGDLILVAEAIDPTSGMRHRPLPSLLTAAQSARLPQIPTHTGRLLTVTRIATTAGEKQAIRSAAADIAALDMETAGAACAAAAAGIPWLAVRAVTDALRDSLPFDFDRWTHPHTGEIARARLTLAALTRPWQIPALIRLGSRSTRAARHLALYLESVVRTLSASS